MYSMMMEYYSWVIRTVTRTADTAGGRLQQLMSTAVRGWARAEAASLGILSLTRDVIFASILLLYKLLVIAYRLTIGMRKTEEETTVPDLIESCGYKVESHSIVTEDGYCLELHRIPSRSGSGKPVLLMHGMMCSSYCWVTSDTSSLAFILARAGYDVWLGNFRGTKYGRRHQTLDPDKDLEFWRFSLHELGVKDIGAMITSILEISGQPKMSFIGHSMGTTCFLILSSYRPHMVRAVDLAILMAPVVEPQYMRNYIKYISPIEWVARIVMETIGILEILPASLLIEKLSWDLIGHLCLKLQLRGTPALKDKDAKMLDKICHHARTSKTSFLTILHYGQNIVNKCFHAYDWYDARENMRRYGSSSAPIYRLSDVQVPVAMFWSPRDSLSSRQDMETLVTELPSIVDCREVNVGHLDYLWGSKVKGDVYHDVLNMLANTE